MARNRRIDHFDVDVRRLLQPILQDCAKVIPIGGFGGKECFVAENHNPVDLGRLGNGQFRATQT